MPSTVPHTTEHDLAVNERTRRALAPPQRSSFRGAGAELVIVLSVFVAYKAVRFLVRDDAQTAFANARDLISFERATGLWSEPELQELMLQWEPVIEWLNQFYARAHLAPTVAVMVFLFALDRPNYLWLRRRLVALTSVALVVHLVYPLAPPRLVGASGMVDTLREFGPEIYGQGSMLSRLANPYAAMPSLHFGFAVLIAWALARSDRFPGRRVLTLHPTLMLIAIVATGNHYWLDAAVCALLLVVVELGFSLVDESSNRRGMLSFRRRVRPVTAAPTFRS